MGLFGDSKPSESAAGQSSAFGPFRLHELINSGGMADLWLASNQKEETFALRIMHDPGRFGFLAKRRFRRGCEILSRIHNHEHVVGYFGHGKLNGRLYLLMEYVEGANMREMLHHSDPVLVDHVWIILRDMALALEHVHDSGFMHLDYKPENLLITRNGQVRLTDFDLSLPRPAKPAKLGKYGGTPAYMAPELLLNKPSDHRVDIFAFGVTAYELLTRKRPFVGESDEEVLRRRLDPNHALIPLREHNPDFSVPLERVIHKALEHDPDKRYQDMSLLLRDLQAAP